jgi:hypothetical protein
MLTFIVLLRALKITGDLTKEADYEACEYFCLVYGRGKTADWPLRDFAGLYGKPVKSVWRVGGIVGIWTQGFDFDFAFICLVRHYEWAESSYLCSGCGSPSSRSLLHAVSLSLASKAMYANPNLSRQTVLHDRLFIYY